MPRPRKIDRKTASLISDMRERGLSQTAIVRALSQRGVRICRQTLNNHLNRERERDETLAKHARKTRSAPAPVTPEPAPPSDPAPALSEQAVAAALETDDLAELSAMARMARAALNEWGAEMGYNPVAARTFATLGKYHADVSARLVALRPRAEVETDRLEALGEPARASLLERARARRISDSALQGQCDRMRAVLIENGWL